MQQERFWILLSRKFAKEASAEELKELEMLIQQHPEWQYAVQNLEELWMQKPPADMHGAEDAYLLHINRMEEKAVPFDFTGNDLSADTYSLRRRHNGYRILVALSGIAATLIIVFLFFFNHQGGSNRVQSAQSLAKNVNEISTKHGSKSTIQLPDGSVVWLNAGSKLTYDKEFGNAVREVTLSGEGFFEVMKMEDKPFIIHTKAVDIKVLGTAFNVKAYPGDKTTETSLIRGKIEVSVKSRPNDKFTLKPNEKLVVENEIPVQETTRPRNISQPVIAISTVRYTPADSIAEEALWMKNKLVIRSETFREMALKMERWYDVTIEILDKQLEQKEFNVIFENETVEEALGALSINTPFKFERKGKKIIIYQ